jgi:Chitobiase/beta-hexosaminidase C-terminal domain
MRNLLILLILAVSASLAQAQGNLGAQAAQQANLQAQQQAAIQSQQAAQQAMDQARQANQDAMQAMNQQMQAAAFPGPATTYVPKPSFSLKPGTYTTPQTVKIKESTRGSIIYYTTDGWTPTPDSMRYGGPITINATTKLQAIAIGPYGVRSRVAAAQYTLLLTPTIASSAAAAKDESAVVRNPAVDYAAAPGPMVLRSAAPGPETPVPAVLAPGQVILHGGTPVPLVFSVDVNSKTTDVGDKIPMTLAEDLKDGDTVLVKKGAPAFAVVRDADGSRGGGVPGEIGFEIDSLNANGTLVKLYGSAYKEGQDKAGTAIALGAAFPFAAFLKHGEQAEIKKGTPFTAYVDSDVILTPVK